MNFLKELNKGLPYNSYYNFMNLSFYITRKQILLNKEFKNYLVIGNIQTSDSTDQGKGYYSKFLTYLEQNLPTLFDGICVECIQTERFVNSHLKKGYKEHNSPGAPKLPTTVIKPIKQC